MSNSNKNNLPSDLVNAVTALDEQFSELSRLSIRIESSDLLTDADITRVKSLMNHFTQCAQGISDGVLALSNALNEARAQAETAAQMVAARAEQLQSRQDERQKKMEAFQRLTEKVQGLSASLMDLKPAGDQEASGEDRAKIFLRLSELSSQIQPLIEEAQTIKTDAQNSKMSDLEQEAHALKQSLTAISEKLTSLP